MRILGLSCEVWFSIQSLTHTQIISIGFILFIVTIYCLFTLKLPMMNIQAILVGLLFCGYCQFIPIIVIKSFLLLYSLLGIDVINECILLYSP